MSSDLTSIVFQFKFNMSKHLRQRIYEFEDFRLDAPHLLLYKNERQILLAPKVIETLLALVERHGEVLSKDELMDIVWADSTVEESNLSQNLYLLRKALGETSDGEPLIETLRRRGYRFNGEVKTGELSSEIKPENTNQKFASVHNNGGAIKEATSGKVIALAEWQNSREGGNQPARFTDSTNTKEQDFVQTEPFEKRSTEKQLAEIAESEALTSDTTAFKSNINKKIVLFAAACLILALSGAFILWQKWRVDSRFEKVELKALTTSGNIVESAVAPDGKLLAYVKSEQGKQSLWIKQIHLRTSEMRLTEPDADNIFKGLTFTPDGSKIYFLLKPKNNSINQLYAVPILGGQPKFILDDVDSPPAFAPDGEQLAFMRRNTKLGVTALLISGADGSDARELTQSKSPLDYRLRPLAWSPDGKIIARVFLDQTKPSDFSIVGFDVESKTEKKLSEQIWNEIEAIAWTKDGSGLIFTASESKSPLGSQLWFLSYPNGAAQKLTNDLSNYVNPSVARQTGEAVVRRTQIENQVWLVNFKLPAAAPRRVSPNNADGEHGLLWTPDGNLIYSSEINGTNSLQKMSIQDFSPTALTTSDKYVFRMPCATPDGRYLVYTSTQENQFHLWRVNADGKNPKQLTAANIENPNCSPDSLWIFYGAVADGKSSLWKVSIDGGEPQRVTEKISFYPQISPDETRIACYYRADAKAAWQIAILKTDEDRVLQTFDLPKTVALSSPFVWTKEGDGLILIDTRDGIANLWIYPLDGQTPTQLTNFNDDSLPFINNFAVSPDGSQLALTRGRKISDVVEIVGADSPTVR